MLGEDKDVICALATAQGTGGISIIRVSGNQSKKLITSLCTFLPKKLESHKVYYGFILDPKTNKKVDEVMVTYFKKGRSYTSEDSFEISLHGNPILSNKILELLVSHGARIAKRGEFTYRAFLNGRIDLTQAEAVLSLIESQSQTAASLALSQLSGGLKKELDVLESMILRVMAEMEATIDFSHEDLDLDDIANLKNVLIDASNRVLRLLETYEKSEHLFNNLKIVLTGKPNAGKSSLFNLFLEEDRSIVTDISGTTRDLITESKTIGNHVVDFIDSAGVRDTKDIIEKLGIEKTQKAIESAQLVMYVVDLSKDSFDEDTLELKKIKKPLWVLLNKSDLVSDSVLNMAKKQFAEYKTFTVSALEKSSFNKLIENINDEYQYHLSEDSAALFKARQYDHLKKVKIFLEKTLTLLNEEESYEFIALELQSALLNLYEVTGKKFDDQVMDRVFSEFCIGK